MQTTDANAKAPFAFGAGHISENEWKKSQPNVLNLTDNRQLDTRVQEAQ